MSAHGKRQGRGRHHHVGPDDGPGWVSGEERLHYWVFGGPWTYDGERTAGSAAGEDARFLEESMVACGAVVCGRGTFEAAGAWGGTNPWARLRSSWSPTGSRTNLLRRPASTSPRSGHRGRQRARGGRRQERQHHGWRRAHPTGACGRSRRRGGDHDRTSGSRPRQTALRRIRSDRRPGEAHRLELAAGDSRPVRRHFRMTSVSSDRSREDDALAPARPKKLITPPAASSTEQATIAST